MPAAAAVGGKTGSPMAAGCCARLNGAAAKINAVAKIEVPNLGMSASFDGKTSELSAAKFGAA
jgi:hypothetical protein